MLSESQCHRAFHGLTCARTVSCAWGLDICIAWLRVRRSRKAGKPVWDLFQEHTVPGTQSSNLTTVPKLRSIGSDRHVGEIIDFCDEDHASAWHFMEQSKEPPRCDVRA